MEITRLEQVVSILAAHPEKVGAVKDCLDDLETRLRNGQLEFVAWARLVQILLVGSRGRCSVA